MKSLSSKFSPRLSTNHFRKKLQCPRTKQHTVKVVDGGSIALTSVLLASLPLSIVIDGAMDIRQSRIQHVTNTDADGVRCYVARPAIETPETLVVVLVHQIFGVRKREVELCQDLASKGYIAVAPDTFDGCCTDYVPRALTLGYKAVLETGATYGVTKLAHVSKWLESQEWAMNKPVVMAGFCYGGGAALRFVSEFPEVARSVVVFYGKPLEKEEDIARLQASVLAFYGTNDRQFPAHMIEAFEASLKKFDKRFVIKTYAGLGHAFIRDIDAIRQGGPPADAWTTFLAHLRDVAGANTQIRKYVE